MNKVIIPKSRASALSTEVRQTDKHFAQKDTQYKTPLKQLFDGQTEGLTDLKVVHEMPQKLSKTFKWSPNSAKRP